jgi:hypothetical protein
MLERFRPRRPSHTTVVAYLALFAALSTGGAYASHLVVDSSDVVDDSLTGADVQGKAGTSTTPAVNGSLTTNEVGGQQANPSNGTPFIDGTLTQWDVKDNSLVSGDLAGNTVTGAKIKNETVGAADIATDAVGTAEIAAGAAGARELKLILTFARSIEVSPGGGVGEVTATCPAGHLRLGGGAEFAFPSGDISASRPAFPEAWVAEGQNNGNAIQQLAVWVSCLSP